MGKVNDSAFLGIEAEKVLFEGAEISSHMDHMSCPAFNATLLFAVRVVTGAAGDGKDGWNFVLRVKGTNPGIFAKPKSAAGNYLYTSTSFAGLFT
jgi:hypothetical protein